MNITELKELAEKSTPGPWKSRKGFHDGTVEIFAPDKDIKPPFYPTELASVEADRKQGKANAKFIAAANPAEILELIANLEDAQGEIRALRATEEGLQDRLAQVEAEHAALLKAISDAEPVAWDVYVEEADNGYLVDSLDDPQLADDCTNHNAVVTPLYTLNGIKKP